MVIFILPVKVKAQAAVNTYLNFLDLAKLAQAIELLNEGKEILISCEDCSLADIRRVTINQSEFAIGGTEGQSNNIRINGAIEDLGYIYIFNYALDSWFVLTSYIDLPKVLDAPLFFHAAQFSAPKSTTKSVPSSGSVTVGEYDQFLSLPTAEIVAQTKQRLENRIDSLQLEGHVLRSQAARETREAAQIPDRYKQQRRDMGIVIEIAKKRKKSHIFGNGQRTCQSVTGIW